MKNFWRLPLFALALSGLAAPSFAQDAPVVNWYGAPGLLDMPSGFSAKEGDFSVSILKFGNIGRTNFSFQITPRIGGTFRYGRWGEWGLGGDEEYFERSLDLRYQLVQEDREGWKPGIVVGLQDLGGTGLYSGEYVAASKHFGERFTVTAGLGWGRLGSNSPFASFGTRPTDGVKGTINADHWFRGDVAPFGGVTFKVNEKLTLIAEYSSDAYLVEENDEGVFEVKSPVNFGIEYRQGKRLRLGAAYMYGSEFGLMATILLNPNEPPVMGSLGGAPTPVRNRDAAAAASWSLPGGSTAATETDYRTALAKALGRQGLGLESLSISGTTAKARIRNGKYDAEAQAIGRAARVMTTILPPQIDTFIIEPMANNLPAAAITLKRGDLERFENAPDGTEKILGALDLSSPSVGRDAEDIVAGNYPKFSWGITPYVDFGLGNLNNPLSADFGLRLSASYAIAPGLIASGAISQKVLGNISNAVPSSSPLPHVRSDGAMYSSDEPVLENATLAYYFQPGRDLYSRVTFGYLERMFGGIDGEVLWKPVDQPYALGVEVAYAQQRDYQDFGFRDYDVITGHVSGYYAFENGYNVALHAGRYLAGDWGATFNVSRQFNNGWKVSAYATFTDVSYADFGAGAFSKGLRVDIPISWATGKPTRRVNPLNLMSMGGDGGARLNVGGRLYDEIQNYHGQSLVETGGMFWR
jgi:hypothetical protein